MAISLCIITKNNQDSIERCIKSVKEIVDEIILVDTGSSDETIKIAEQLGAKIYNFAWNDNFSEAKNFALEKATGEWILALDADETIAKKDLDKVRALQEEKVLGFSFIQRNYKNGIGLFSAVSCKDDDYEESKISNCFIPRRIVRMFKNDSRIRFEMVVHDTVELSILKLSKILDTEIPIHHFGMLNRSPERTKKYIELEKKNLRNDYFQDYQIAIQLHEIGEINEALKFLSHSINLNPNFSLSWLELGIIFLKQRKIGEAEIALKNAEKLGNHEMIFFHLGIVYGIQEKYELSIEYFNKALSINSKNADTYFNLGLTYRSMGEFVKSREELKKAVYLNEAYKERVESLL